MTGASAAPQEGAAGQSASGRLETPGRAPAAISSAAGAQATEGAQPRTATATTTEATGSAGSAPPSAFEGAHSSTGQGTQHGDQSAGAQGVPATESAAPATQATGSAPAAQQSASPEGSAASTARLGAQLEQQIETLRATVELARRDGGATAQIVLEPEDLGTLRIHLTQTSAGLIARVSASSAAGAQMMDAGRGDLRSMLSTLGVSLLRLDIGSSATGQGGAQQREVSQEGASARQADGSDEDAQATPSSDDAPVLARAARLGSIDVLA